MERNEERCTTMNLFAGGKGKKMWEWQWEGAGGDLSASLAEACIALKRRAKWSRVERYKFRSSGRRCESGR